MKKILAVCILASTGLMAFSSVACPQGTHLTGGVGSHHLGGHCTSASSLPVTQKVKQDVQKDIKQTRKTAHKEWKHTKHKISNGWNKAKSDTSKLEKAATQRTTS
ncbi:hypothetical protein [Pantoea sp. KPR_PJ]|uniref:hypothetical protein n=1 Tax=Pantoea sp. KPR_PJ TaxID=2738375 RepID=UPI003529BB53